MTRHSCPQCDYEVDPDQVWCDNCGSFLHSVIVTDEVQEPTPPVPTPETDPQRDCRSCGQALNPGNRQCTHCLTIADSSPLPGPTLLTLSFPDGALLLRPGEPILIGRFQDCAKTVPCLGAETISRRHATIVVTEAGAHLTDHHSLNHTYINTTRLTPEVPYPLKLRDVVTFGAHTKGTIT